MRIRCNSMLGIVTAIALLPSLTLLSSLTLLASTALGQLPQVDDGRLGVDRIDLSSGQRVYGFVLQRSLDGSASVAVERVWLQTTHPKLATEWSDAQTAAQQAAREELLTRLDQWIAEQAGADRFQRFLQLERDKLAATKPDADESFFLTRELASDEIRKLTIQPPDRRHIAGIAYQHRLANVVTTPTASLLRQLSERNVDPTQEQVDLTGDLPVIHTQSPRQWAARQALVEFHMLEPLEFQGTGTQLFRKGSDVDAQALVGQLLGGSGADAISRLGAELGLPEFKPPAERGDWWHAVTAEAERDGFRGVLITRLEQNLLSTKVVVNAHFFAMEAPGNWFLVRSFQGESDASMQAGEQLERLRADPQIASLINTLEGLGLGANTQLDRALQHGAATQDAMQAVQSAFSKFTEQQVRSLSALPVQLP